VSSRRARSGVGVLAVNADTAEFMTSDIRVRPLVRLVDEMSPPSAPDHGRISDTGRR
jgi:hypothetical protein